MGPKRKYSDTITVHVKTMLGKTISVEISPKAHVKCERCDLDDRPLTALTNSVCNNKGWEMLFTTEVVKEYARFFELKCAVKDFQDFKLCAPPLIDAVWVTHMEDSALEYGAYCHSASEGPHIMKRILKQNTAHALRATKLAYEARFEEPPNERFWASDAEPVLALTPSNSLKAQQGACNCLAKILQEKEGISINVMRLVYEGAQISHRTESLEELGVDDQATIQLILAMKGC